MANTFKTDQVDSRGRAIYKDRDTGTYFTIDPKTGQKIAGKLGANDPKNKAASSGGGNNGGGGSAPSGDLSSSADLGNRFGNFSLALKNAINEGTAARKGLQAGMVMPFVSGGVNGTSDVVSMIKNSSRTSAVSVFESAMGGFQAQIEDERKKQEFTYGLIKDMASDGSLAGVEDSVLLKMAGQAGLEQGTLLAWKARLKIANAQSDQMAALEIRKIESEISENLAQAGAAGRANRGSGAPKAPSSVTERQLAAVAQYTPDIMATLDTARGSDGKVDPNVYSNIRQNATRLGITPSSFDDAFGTELSPTERKNLLSPSGYLPTEGVEQYIKTLVNERDTD